MKCISTHAHTQTHTRSHGCSNTLQHLLMIHDPSITDGIWTVSVGQADKSWKLWAHRNVPETNAVLRERCCLRVHKNGKRKKKTNNEMSMIPSDWWSSKVTGWIQQDKLKGKKRSCGHLFWERSPLETLVIRPHVGAANRCLGSKCWTCNSTARKSNQNRITVLNPDWNFKLWKRLERPNSDFGR